MEFYTWCRGSKVAKCEVTRGDIACVWKELVALFGPNYAFIPEAVYEGGIKMSRWPGSDETPDAYKTFRFLQQPCSSSKWPFIENESVVDSWNGSTDIIWTPLCSLRRKM
jgi:hypothetical protein